VVLSPDGFHVSPKTHSNPSVPLYSRKARTIFQFFATPCLAGLVEPAVNGTSERAYRAWYQAAWQKSRLTSTTCAPKGPLVSWTTFKPNESVALLKRHLLTYECHQSTLQVQLMSIQTNAHQRRTMEIPIAKRESEALQK
jgi:hypothetical protein